MPMKIFNTKKVLNEAKIEFDGLIEITEDLRGKIQETVLEMFDDLKSFCDFNGFTLYLIGGTLLGAVRHKGFIPWDDDLDVALSRDDYERFKAFFSHSEMRKKYILNAPNYSEYPKDRFPQLIKKGTVCEKPSDGAIDTQLKGFKLDIFIIDNVPDSRIKRQLKGVKCNCLEFIASKVQSVECDDQVCKEIWSHAGRMTYYFSRAVGKIFSIVKSTTWLNWIDHCIQCKEKDSKCCTIATGRNHYFGEILPRKVFYPQSEIEFCGRKVHTIHNPDMYLKNLYGDYMQIPPVNKRERHLLMNIDFGDGEETN